MPRPRLRVLIVDDHDVVRLGLWAAVSKRHLVVGHCATGAEALEHVSRSNPDVVLTDLRLPDLRGEELCRRVRARDSAVSVVILSAYLSEETVRLALEAGAAAYVTKAAGLPELMRVLDELAHGSAPGRAETALQIVARLHATVARQTCTVRLSPQQESILELAAQGLTNGQIGNRLFISESTVRFHLQNLKEKLRARSKTELVVLAMRLGIISPAPESIAAS
jgi:DNA-binding NarL/FixJ family response regulator